VRRSGSAFLCLAVALTAPLLVASPGSADAPAGDRARHGEDAVRALGERLPAVARAHQTSAAVLRERLRSDATLWVDADDALLYVDEAPRAGSEEVAGPGTGTGAAPASAVDVFALHSLPGARRTIHLDFDGVGGTYGGTIGGAWSRSYTGGDSTAEPYDLDGDVTTFSADERADIYSAWQRVAEDYAPFAIDVTTQEPGTARIERTDSLDQEYGTRLAITSTSNSCGCGGVAYVGVFDKIGAGSRGHAYNQPAFVYTRGGKYVAEAASHEAGHNLGLSHDGTSTEGYYVGHGDWAPIMGVGYYEPISQWSKGEYPDANNPEDDFVVAAANGGERRGDSGGATLQLGQPVERAIEAVGDTDAFELTVPGATTDPPVTVSVGVEPSLVSPNLDVVATLSPGPGAFSKAAPVGFSSDVAGGLGSTLTAQLQPGTTYSVTVGATGSGTSADGYGTYGSLGGYTVTASLGSATAGVAPPTPASFAVASPTADGRIAISWADGGGETSYEVFRYSVSGGTDTLSRTVAVSADRQSYTDSPGAGSWAYQLLAVNPTGASALTSRSATVTVVPTRKGGRK
jgi:hypothetical protein